MALNFKQGSPARSYTVLVLLLAISIASMVLYSREDGEGPLHSAQSMVSGLFSPALAASGGISSAEDTIASAVEDATATPETLNALREQNQELRSTIAQLEEYRQEAERLQGTFKLTSAYDANTVTGRVLSRSMDPWNLVVTIDKGSNDGIRSGLPVLGSAGLVGQVVSTTPFTSDVRLLADPQSGVAVLIQSSRDEGIVRGNLDGLLYLENVDDDAEVKVGDVVITSGLGGGFFRGIIVGTVVKVEGEPGSSKFEVVVEPNTNTKAYEEITVITSMNTEKAEEYAEKLAQEKEREESSSSSGSSSSSNTQEGSNQSDQTNNLYGGSDTSGNVTYYDPYGYYDAYGNYISYDAYGYGGGYV